jgi:hypothetical protein
MEHALRTRSAEDAGAAVAAGFVLPPHAWASGLLTPAEEAEIKERHRPYARDESVERGPDDPMWCDWCADPWPCDAARLLLSFAALEKRVRGIYAEDGYPDPA